MPSEFVTAEEWLNLQNIVLDYQRKINEKAQLKTETDDTIKVQSNSALTDNTNKEN